VGRIADVVEELVPKSRNRLFYLCPERDEWLIKEHFMIPRFYLVCFLGGLCPILATGAEVDEATKTFLRNCVANTKAAIVLGVVDDQGSTVFGAGVLDNNTDRSVDGDSMFFIGSVTKTFTALLLLEMAQRGEVQLDDPVGKYLPVGITLPEHGGKPITLLHLATHTAGLPVNPNNMAGRDDREQYETYTAEKMYAFLANHKLGRDPGAEFEYSNVGMALLGHALQLRAGIPFEQLVSERICAPLGMENTRFELRAEQLSRLAMGHEQSGQHSTPWTLDVYRPAGDLHSNASDLLKYVAAQISLPRTTLTPLMEQSHVFRHEDKRGLPGQGASGFLGRTAMDWVDRSVVQPPGMELLGHAGGAGSYHAFIGFDKKQRRGIVLLSTGNDFSLEAVGWTVLQRAPLTEERKYSFARDTVGIGVALELDKSARGLRIAKVLPESPAAEANLSEGLLIVRIDDVLIAGKPLASCLDLLRGPAGTQVRLELADSDFQIKKVVQLTRQKIATVPSAPAKPG
jgi:CubicO group peptidase (beta-lactamase class C family)